MEIENNFSKISKDTLKYLGIKNTFFQLDNGLTAIIQPVFIETEKWTVISSSPLSSGFLIIEFSDSKKTKLKCQVKKKEIPDFSNSFILLLKESFSENFIQKLMSFKKVTGESEKRKEARFDVGLENWKTFGLLKPEVFLCVNKKNLRCIINNASCHGVLLTGETALINYSDLSVKFVCSFNKPKVNIIQPGIIVNSQILQKNYSRYSLQFLDPVNFTWQEKLLDYARTKN